MTQPTRDEVIAWIDERIQEREGRIEGNDSCVRELSLAIQYEQDENTTATIIHLENLIRIDKEILASLLALRSIVELCNENTDHHLVDKSWILEAIEREFR